jgi:acyl carrier protein
MIVEALFEVAPNKKFGEITLDSTIEDLHLDSIAIMEMVGVLEDRVDATFPDEDLAKVHALKDLAALVRGGRVGAA